MAQLVLANTITALSIFASLLLPISSAPIAADEVDVPWQTGADQPFYGSLPMPKKAYPVTPLPGLLQGDFEDGQVSINAMHSGGQEQSRYTESLAAWKMGWRTNPERNFDVKGLGLDEAFGELRISTSPSSWTKVEQKHCVAGSSQDGKSKYPPTNAVISNIFNPLDGVMVTYMKEEPAKVVREKKLPITGEQLVPLRTWQDLTYLGWTSLANGEAQRTRLKHIFSYDVEDEAALGVMKMLVDWKKYPAADPSYRTPPKWPGVEIPFDEYLEQGTVVLNLFQDVLELLLTHAQKQTLGHKIVDRIHMFGCPKILPNGEIGLLWCVYFHVMEAKTSE